LQKEKNTPPPPPPKGGGRKDRLAAIDFLDKY